MANNSSLYGSSPSTTGNISSSNLTTLYSGNPATVPATGNLVVPGSLTVNGCVILSDCQTFSILPHTSNILIGEAGGTTTFQSQLLTANYSFPVNDGTTGQVLTTNGSGDLVFVNTSTVGRTYNIGASTTTGGADFDLVGSDGSIDTIKFAAGTNMTITATDNSTITFTSAGAIVYTQNASATTGGANLNLVGSDGSTDSIKFASGSGIVVTRTDADTITISNNSPGTTYSQNFSSTTGGTNLNLVGSDATTDTVKFANGTGIAIAYTDANTATLTNTGVTSAVAGTGVSVSAATGAVTFSIGQSVATSASPTFNNEYLNGQLYLNYDQTVGNAVINAYSGATLGTLTWGSDGNWTSSNGFKAGQVRGGNVVIGYPGNQDLNTTSGDLIIGSATGIVELNHTLKINGTTSGGVSLSVPAVAGTSTMIVPAGNDNLVARNTTDTLTNKTISGVNNTLSGIGNASLVNSSITLGTTTTALGATSLTLGGLTSVAVTQDPVSDLQLATKQYVDQMATTGLTFHDPVHLASDAPLGSVAYNQPGGAGVGVGATLTNTGTLQRLKLDNSNTTNGDRVLIKDETNQTYNGVYVVTNEGNGSTAWVLTRATDADTYGSNPNQLSLNDYFFVQTGQTQKGNSYVLNAPVGVITFGTSNITFAEFSTSQVYTATAPIVITGTDISLTTVPITLGGTGQTTANAAINALLPTQSGNAGRVLYTDGSNTSWTDFGSGFTTGNITIAVADDNTISTSAGDLKLTSATGILGINAIVDITADYLNLNSDNSAFDSAMRFGGSAEIKRIYSTDSFEFSKSTYVAGALSANSLNIDSGTLYVDPTNNRVGINNTAPDYEFEISDGGDGFVQLALANTDREFILTNNAGDDLVSFAMRPLPGSTVTNRLQFDSLSNDQWFPVGQLGIGTNTPAYELDVSGTGRFTQNVEVGVDAVLGGNIYIDGNTIYNSYNEKWIEYTQYTDFQGGTSRKANFQATNNIGVGASFLFIDNRTEINTTGLTTSTTAADQVLAVFDTASADAVKSLIRVKSGTEVQCIEVLMVQNGTDISLNTYGDVRTGANLTTVSSGYNGSTGFWELRVSPVNAVTAYTSTHTIMF